MKTTFRNMMIGIALILFLTMLAYFPALRGGFVWDDNAYITDNPLMRNPQGLKFIWTSTSQLPQFYPLLFTGLWIEYQLWGSAPMGYHLVNIVLHAANAILFWQILRYLKVPGSWFAAALFALHPVHVASVAWVTELKNVLSGLFYLAALLIYLKECLPSVLPAELRANRPTGPISQKKKKWKTPRDGQDARRDVSSDGTLPSYGPRQWSFYFLSLFLFLCALLSKVATCTLPIVILILVWWKKPEYLRREAIRLIPMFALALVIGWMAGNVEAQYIIPIAGEFPTSVTQKLAIAGQAFWFYLGKLVRPFDLAGIYPRWQIEGISAWKQGYWMVAAAGMAGLWAARNKIGKAPLVAALFYFVTIGPVLGFVNIAYMRYSFVADHFQYLASLGPIAFFSAAACLVIDKAGSKAGKIKAGCGVLVLILSGILTWRQAGVYYTMETFCRDIVNKNPQCFGAWNNLGLVWFKQGKHEGAINAYNTALRIKPDYAEARNNLGNVYWELKQFDIAKYHYLKSWQYFSKSPAILNRLAFLLATGEDPGVEGKALAIELAENACDLTHYRDPFILATLAAAYARAGRFPEAITTVKKAILIARKRQLKRLYDGLIYQLGEYQKNQPLLLR